MATRTFVGDGASHNWSATGAWVEGIVPTAADDVVFSTNTVGSILVIDGTSGSPSLCRSIDTTGYTRTLTLAVGKELDVGTGTAGAFKLTAGMTFAPSSTSLIKFVSTTTGNNITSAAYALGPLTFDGVGGGWTLQDALVAPVTDGMLITLTNGTLNTNSKNVGSSGANGWNLSSSNANTRALTLGTTSWFVSVSGGGTPWDITTSTGMTLSAGSSTVSFVSPNTSVTFSGGALTYGTLSWTGSTAASNTINGANTFGTLTLTNGATTTPAFILGANQTVSGTLTLTGNSVLQRLFIKSSIRGTPRTITAATVTATNADFQDITGAGASGWNLAAITGGSGDCGGNSGITFTTPITAFYKVGASANWSASNWKTTSGGVTGITNTIPLAQDTARFDANSITAGSVTITVDASTPRLPSVDWTGVTNSPTFAINTARSWFGSVTLAAGMTISSTQGVTLEGRGSNTFTTAGLTWTPATGLNAPGGTMTQADNFTSSNNSVLALTFPAGTWAAGSNNTTLSGASAELSVTGGTLTSSGTISLTGGTAANITVSSGDLNVASGTISMTGVGSTMTLSGGTLEVGTLTRTGFALTISGATVTLGAGGLAYNGVLTVSSGSLVPASGNKITAATATAVTVAATTAAGTSLSRVMTGM